MSLLVLIQIAALALSGGVRPDSIAERVRELVDPLLAARDFAGTILVARGPDTLFVESFGEANVALGIPNRPDTPMRVGSIAKQFTAAAILLLEEEKTLSVDDPLALHLPDFPNGDRITLHQLLVHQSGVVRDVFVDWRDRTRPRSLVEVTREIASRPLDFEPGSQTSYSNGGFTLLAQVVERVSGMPFSRFLARRVFDPLGMTRTGVLAPNEIVPGLAAGYDPGPAPAYLVNTPWEDPSNILGAGGVYSTVGDLHVWSEALESDALLSAPSRQKMLRSYGAGRGYGIGVWGGERPRVGHDGITHGFIAFVDRFLDEDVTIAYTGNVRTGVLTPLREALAAITFDEPYEGFAPPLEMDGGSLERDRLLGTYELFPGFYIEISRQGDDLYLLGTGGYPTVLYPVGPDEYFYRARYERIRFERESGEVTGLTWIDRAGQTYPAKRVSPSPPDG